MGFILTAFSFNPQEVFHSSSFWGLSIIYWFLWICLSPLIMETINEIPIPKKRKPISDEMAVEFSKARKEAIRKHIAGEILTPKENEIIQEEISEVFSLKR
jgi:hypothetical protein